jgi:hypothetical protein
MRNRIVLLSVLLISSVAAAQAPSAPNAPRPSNGVVELSAKPIVARDPGPQSQPPEVYAPWAGLVEITLRNISKGVIRLEEIGTIPEFQVEIWDSTGHPVSLTDAGKRAAASSRQYLGAISVSILDLVPLQDITLKLDVSKRHEIRPGEAYKVTIRRSRGLPTTDEDGKALKNVEVSCSFDVPNYGILR